MIFGWDELLTSLCLSSLSATRLFGPQQTISSSFSWIFQPYSQQIGNECTTTIGCCFLIKFMKRTLQDKQKPSKVLFVVPAVGWLFILLWVISGRAGGSSCVCCGVMRVHHVYVSDCLLWLCFWFFYCSHVYFNAFKFKYVKIITNEHSSFSTNHNVVITIVCPKNFVNS